MFRKKSLLKSGAGFTVAAGALGIPCMVWPSIGLFEAGGGCLIKKAGVMMKSVRQTRGMTTSRPGFKQQNVYTARNDRVCVGVFHEKSRMRRPWKTNTTPILRGYRLDGFRRCSSYHSPRIETTKVVGHGRQTEVWPLDVTLLICAWLGSVCRDDAVWQYLLQESLLSSVTHIQDSTKSSIIIKRSTKVIRRTRDDQNAMSLDLLIEQFILQIIRRLAP